uniref:Cytochrome P450 n=1 Tax=Oryza punctata TaxID=4537 RepID=A0A0E0MEX1_ORYPU
MAFSTLVAVSFSLVPAAILYLLAKYLRRYHSSSYNLPPGELGVPIIGQTMSLLDALRRNADEQWFSARVKTHGPVSKMSVLGSPTVLLAGPEANRFIFGSGGGGGLVLTQTSALRALVGRSVLTFAGDELRQVRGALQGYLKPDMVRRYVSRMDGEVRRHIDVNWAGRTRVTVLPLARSLSFGVICSVVFGEDVALVRDTLSDDFVALGKAVMSFPVRLPFTRFSKGMDASARIRKAITEIFRRKEVSLLQGPSAPCHGTSDDTDFITYMLSLRSQGSHTLPLEDIVDNAMGLVIGAHGTTSVLITFMIRYLANEPDVLDKVTREQDEITANKGSDDALTWDDIARMKYTWRVAMETLRIVPPVFGSFRTATKDLEYQGYDIPKGWKVFAAQSITHMNANFFHEPTKFDPARFEKSVPPYCFMPFGGGPRMCPGNEFARVETMVVMHYLVRQFRWKLCCKKEAYIRDPKPVPVHGLPIELKQRRT